MNKLKRLAVSFTLMSVLAVAAFGGETAAPPCAPGQTNTPPCAAQSMNDDSTPNDGSTTPGELQSPPVSNSAIEVIDIAEAVLWALSLF